MKIQARYWVLLFLFAFFQTYLRFQGVGNTCYTAVYPALVDPTLFPGDIYVHNPSFVTTSFYWRLVPLIGPIILNDYFLFFVQFLLTCLNVACVFAIALKFFQEASKTVMEADVAFAAVAAFTYDYVAENVPSNIAYMGSFTQSVFCISFVYLALAYYIWGRPMRAAFILFCVALQFNVKYSWFPGCIMALDYIVLQKVAWRRKVLFLLLACLGGVLFVRMASPIMPMATDYATRLAAAKAHLRFALSQDDPFLNFKVKPGEIELCMLVLALGLSVSSFVQQGQRRFLRLMIYFGMAQFWVGGVYIRYFLDRWPYVQLIYPNYTAALAFPMIFSMLSIGGVLYSRAKFTQHQHPLLGAALFMLLGVLCVFPNDAWNIQMLKALVESHLGLTIAFMLWFIVQSNPQLTPLKKYERLLEVMVGFYLLMMAVSETRSRIQNLSMQSHLVLFFTFLGLVWFFLQIILRKSQVFVTTLAGAVFLTLAVNAGIVLRTSYLQNYVFFPLKANADCDQDCFAVQMWARNYTLKSSTFISFTRYLNELWFDDYFRKYSWRPMYYGMVELFPYLPKVQEEHRRRQPLIEGLKTALLKKEPSQITSAVEAIPFDYLVVQTEFGPYVKFPLVYSNPKWNVYRVRMQ